MVEQIITNEDLQYLASESSRNLNMILAGMTSLMEENSDKVNMIENQNWFQRMSNTISGKNKMTQQEIERNHDKINLYVTQAIGELYARECIDHEIVLGLGNKINELYEAQVEIKQIIGAFAQKLNQKIESIDNYHMLIEEINQAVYKDDNSFVSISMIMSQLDLRTVQDNRKMEILVRAMSEQKIVEDKEILFSEMLEDLLSLNESKAGVLALFFGNMRDEYVAEIAEKTIFTYYSLPEKTRKMKSKRSVVESVLKENDIDLEYAISSREMCETLIDAYANNVIAVAIEEQKNEEDEKREFISDYIDASMELLFLLRDMVETWEAKNGEMNTRQSRKEYAEFMGNLIDNLDKNSFIGNSIITNLNNMTFFAQKLFSKYEYLRISEVTNEDIKALADAFAEGNYNSEDICQKVNKNVAIELPTYDLATDTSGTKFSTVSEYFLEFVHNMFDNSEMGRTRQLYSFQTLNSVAEDFPDPSNYTGFGLMYFYMKTYVAMFYTIFDDVKDELDDSSFLEDVFNLCNKYPVEYNDEYDELLVRYLDMEDIPHIELEYVQHGHFSEKSIGYANLGFLKDYETVTVIVRFVNVNISGYTASYHVLENSYVDMSTWDSYKYVDIEWGDWVEDNALELKITKNNSESFGSFKMKVYVKQNETIVAYIQ